MQITGCLMGKLGWEVTANGSGGSFWGDANVLKSDSSDGYTNL